MYSIPSSSTTCHPCLSAVVPPKTAPRPSDHSELQASTASDLACLHRSCSLPLPPETVQLLNILCWPLHEEHPACSMIFWSTSFVGYFATFLIGIVTNFVEKLTNYCTIVVFFDGQRRTEKKMRNRVEIVCICWRVGE